MSALRRLPRVPVIHSSSFGVFATLVVLGLNVVINLAIHMPWSDYLATAYFALYAIACTQHYRARREYHCLITGPGCLLAAVAVILRDTGAFDHGFGVPLPHLRRGGHPRPLARMALPTLYGEHIPARLMLPGARPA